MGLARNEYVLGLRRVSARPRGAETPSDLYGERCLFFLDG